MANIKIEIDTNDLTVTNSFMRTPATAPLPLGVLSTINLTQSLYDLFTDIENGYGTKRKAHHHNVPRDLLKAQRDDLVRKGCKILTTVGGLYANMDIDGDAGNVTFVSLVGEAPTNPSNKCAGGVYLNSITTNADRRKFLIDNKKPDITDRSMIGLYRPAPEVGAQTKVSSDEEQEWNDLGTIFDSSGDYDQDFNGGLGIAVIPDDIKAIIISGSPFFLVDDNMTALVEAANAWLADDDTRYIVYPLQIYSETSPQPRATLAASGQKRITFFGPNLHEACKMLGDAAKTAQGGGNPGWQQAPMHKSEM